MKYLFLIMAFLFTTVAAPVFSYEMATDDFIRQIDKYRSKVLNEESLTYEKFEQDLTRIQKPEVLDRYLKLWVKEQSKSRSVRDYKKKLGSYHSNLFYYEPYVVYDIKWHRESLLQNIVFDLATLVTNHPDNQNENAIKKIEKKLKPFMKRFVKNLQTFRKKFPQSKIFKDPSYRWVSPLLLGIEEKNIMMVRLALKEGDLANAQRYSSAKPFRMAIEKGQYEIVKELLPYDHNAMSYDYGYLSPIITHTVGWAHYEPIAAAKMVQLFIKHGADISETATTSNLPSYVFAAQNGHILAAQHIIQAVEKMRNQMLSENEKKQVVLHSVMFLREAVRTGYDQDGREMPDQLWQTHRIRYLYRAIQGVLDAITLLKNSNAYLISHTEDLKDKFNPNEAQEAHSEFFPIVRSLNKLTIEFKGAGPFYEEEFMNFEESKQDAIISDTETMLTETAAKIKKLYFVETDPSEE